MRSPDDRHELERAARYDGERTPEEIEAEIAATRAELRETLHAIQGKLSTRELMDQALYYLRAGPGEYFQSLGQSAKENPLPLALVGIGLGWLMVSERSDGRYYPIPEHYSVEERFGPAVRPHHVGARQRIGGMIGGMRRVLGGVGRSTREGWHATRASVGGAMDRLGETASSAREGAGHMAHGLQETTGRMVHGMQETSGRVMHGMHETSGQLAEHMHARGERLSGMSRHQAERLRSGFNHMLHEQPLVLGALGLALGAMVAGSLPTTRREDETLGPLRDRMLDQAAEKGQEQLEKAERVAAKAGEAARQEAEHQGMAGTAAGSSPGSGSSTGGGPHSPGSPRT